MRQAGGRHSEAALWNNEDEAAVEHNVEIHHDGDDGTAAGAVPARILRVLQTRLGTEKSAAIIRVVQEIPSAQQRVVVLHCRPPQSPVKSTRSLDSVDTNVWTDALRTGRQHVVLRIWHGANRWWNLNHINHENTASDRTKMEERPSLLREIAKNEVWGYRMARGAFATGTNVRIPAVLYFSLEDEDEDHPHDNADEPWAIFEYVGEKSELFEHERKCDNSWTQGMVKMRDEFGFVEPHPRWGRVPVNIALDYAMMVLEQVILPLHRYCYRKDNSILPTATATTLSAAGIEPKSYAIVVEVCRQKYDRYVVRKSGTETETKDELLNGFIVKLGAAITMLEQDAATMDNLKLLPPVVCHMDLQPQNILFAQQRENGSNSSPPTSSLMNIVSVLDWEEAAYADPRFELLMLCRKVCANRTQADRIWRKYQSEMSASSQLGPMEPWLRLETVHSLTTLLLQATAGGGRSPWESRRDLQVKMERECHRWCLLSESTPTER